MRFRSILVLVFLLAFSSCLSIKKHNSEIKSKNLGPEVQAKNIINPKVKKRLLAKEDAFPEGYYKPKKTRYELEKEFKEHLKNIMKTCDDTIKNKKDFFHETMNNFYKFLEISLKDHNLDYGIKLLFSDISYVLEEISEGIYIDLDSFILSYRSLYQIPDEIEIENYSHEWAKIIAKAIRCVK